MVPSSTPCTCHHTCALGPPHLVVSTDGHFHSQAAILLARGAAGGLGQLCTVNSSCLPILAPTPGGQDLAEHRAFPRGGRRRL